MIGNTIFVCIHLIIGIANIEGVYKKNDLRIMSSLFNPTLRRYILLGSNNYQPDQSTFTQHLKKQKHLHQYNNEEVSQRLTLNEGQI